VYGGPPQWYSASIYNFRIPSQLTTWIDITVRPGKDLCVRGARPAGPGRRQAGHVAIARGDFYESETAAISAEHAESYMRTVLSFIGLNNPEFVLGQCMEVTVGAASVMPSPRNLCGQCWEM
jgi:FMN-dependent NADH-azoreductase